MFVKRIIVKVHRARDLDRESLVVLDDLILAHADAGHGAHDGRRLRLLQPVDLQVRHPNASHQQLGILVHLLLVK